MIKQIELEHVESFWRCLDAVARERRYLAFIEAPPLHRSRQYVETGIRQGVPRYIAVFDGKVVAWCDVVPRAEPGFTHSGALGMGVLKSRRGQGLGRRIMDVTISRAWEIGLDRIDLRVYASNTVAVRLYERAGFRVEGVQRRARYLDDTYDDVMMMALLRNTSAD